MARIAALELLLHLGVGALPEALQILRDLDRPARRRQQVQRHRHAAAADARRVGEAEQFLQLHRQHRWLAGCVFEPAALPAGHGELIGCLRVERAALLVIEHGGERLRQRFASQRVEPALAFEIRRQPLLQRGQQVRVADIGQSQLRHPRAQCLDARAQPARRIAPRQRVQSAAAHRGEQRGQRVGWLHRHAAPLQHDGAEALLLECLHRGARLVPAQHPHAREAGGKIPLELARIERRGGQDQAVAGLVAQVQRHQPRLAEQRGLLVQAGAAAVGQRVAQRLARIAKGDAVGKRMRQQVAHRVAVRHAAGGGAHVEATTPALGRLFDRRQRAHVGLDSSATATIAPHVQRAHAGAEVVAARQLAAQR